MKQLSEKQKKHFLSCEKKKRRQQLRRKRIKLQRLRRKHLRELDRLKNPDYYKTIDLREQRQKSLYKKIEHKKPPITIEIKGEFGIEDKNGINYFLDKAETFIDFKSAGLFFDFKKCTRVWPSAITLLCSLKQWVELTTKPKKRPKLASSSSDSSEVNSYLAHCGFYDYVGRPKDVTANYYSNTEIVKIERETKTGNIEHRETQIMELLKKWSALSDEELEKFDCIVLTEIFNNVTEHGISHIDKGWWLLGQYHRRHNIISLCVADNGIGIRNSLMTGPQRDEIEKKLKDTEVNDGEFIKLALKENVSGSISASKKSGFIVKRYESGARRGNGLKRIEKSCRELKIPLSLISHHGYAFIDEYGNITKCGARKAKVFAGTMYHLVIQGKQE